MTKADDLITKEVRKTKIRRIANFLIYFIVVELSFALVTLLGCYIEKRFDLFWSRFIIIQLGIALIICIYIEPPTFGWHKRKSKEVKENER